jgi:prevent-host-death family protein
MILVKVTNMNFSTQIKPISYLKSHTAEMAKELAKTRQPVIITQNGEAKFVVIDVHSYEQQEETLSLLKILALGQHEIEQGLFRSATEVFSDLDKEE